MCPTILRLLRALCDFRTVLSPPFPGGPSPSLTAKERPHSFANPSTSNTAAPQHRRLRTPRRVTRGPRAPVAVAQPTSRQHLASSCLAAVSPSNALSGHPRPHAALDEVCNPRAIARFSVLASTRTVQPSPRALFDQIRCPNLQHARLLPSNEAWSNLVLHPALYSV